MRFAVLFAVLSLVACTDPKLATSVESLRIDTPKIQLTAEKQAPSDTTCTNIGKLAAAVCIDGVRSNGLTPKPGTVETEYVRTACGATGATAAQLCKSGQTEMYNGSTGKGVCEDIGSFFEDSMANGCIWAALKGPFQEKDQNEVLRLSQECAAKWIPTAIANWVKNCHTDEKNPAPKQTAKPVPQGEAL